MSETFRGVTRVDDWVEYSCEDVREDRSCIDQVLYSRMLVELAGFSFHRASSTNLRLYPRGTRYVSIASC